MTKMTTRILALLLCLSMLAGAIVLTGCSAKDDDDIENQDKGEQIVAYLGANVYDLDPAHCYNNEAMSNLVGLMFATLFKLDEKGNVQNYLAKSYTVKEDKVSGEKRMYIKLIDTAWSNGAALTANDVVFAWQRILNVENSFDAACLLFDVKNARAAKQGDISIDDVGIHAESTTEISISFEDGFTNYDQFRLNLTSVALAPLYESYVSKSADWAKKASTIACSGPFKLSSVSVYTEETDDANASAKVMQYKNGMLYDDINYTVDDESHAAASVVDYFGEVRIRAFALERNAYYQRNAEKDALDKSVKPYRIVCDATLTDKQIVDAYNAGELLYIGDIPLSLRSNESIVSLADIKDSLSTHVYYFNENAVIGGAQLFANKAVRQALSMAIDRDAIAEQIVFAKAADGIVPGGVFASNSAKKTFRGSCTQSYDTLKKNVDAAKQLLEDAGIDPTAYAFSVTVATYDDVHMAAAKEIVNAWNELGFSVTIRSRGTVANNDYYKPTDSTPVDVCDDLYGEDFRSGEFEVIALDLCANSVDPFSVLAPFAKEFSGQGMDMSNTNYELTPHITGYDSAEYNALIEKIFKEKDASKRVDDLMKAEKMLMEDLPVMPVFYNQSATITSSSLKGVSSTYTEPAVFTKAHVADYEEYVATCKAYIEENFEDLTLMAPYVYAAKIDTKGRTALDIFKEATTIYSFAFETKKK